MADKTCFRYRIEFGFYENPVSLIETFQRELREKVAAIRCELFSNGLMNSVSQSQGIISRATASDDDRRQIADWIKQQRIKGRVTIGVLEDEESMDIRAHVVGETFNVDNLSDQDREAAAEKRAEIDKLIAARRQPASDDSTKEA